MVLPNLEDSVSQAHVAAEYGVSRPAVATWVTRYRTEGEPGLHDRTSRSRSHPSQLNPGIIAEIESLRRDRKWSARRIHHHLLGPGYQLHLRTVGQWLHRMGTPGCVITPQTDRTCTTHPSAPEPPRAAGHMVHLGVKKLGRISGSSQMRV